MSKLPGMHADGGGLYLRVSPAGVPSWVYRYLGDAGRERYMAWARDGTTTARKRGLVVA